MKENLLKIELLFKYTSIFIVLLVAVAIINGLEPEIAAPPQTLAEVSNFIL